MTASNLDKQAVIFFDEGDNLMVCDRARARRSVPDVALFDVA